MANENKNLVPGANANTNKQNPAATDKDLKNQANSDLSTTPNVGGQDGAIDDEMDLGTDKSGEPTIQQGPLTLKEADTKEKEVEFVAFEDHSCIIGKFEVNLTKDKATKVPKSVAHQLAFAKKGYAKM